MIICSSISLLTQNAFIIQLNIYLKHFFDYMGCTTFNIWLSFLTFRFSCWDSNNNKAGIHRKCLVLMQVFSKHKLNRVCLAILNWSQTYDNKFIVNLLLFDTNNCITFRFSRGEPNHNQARMSGTTRS